MDDKMRLSDMMWIADRMENDKMGQKVIKFLMAERDAIQPRKPIARINEEGKA